MISATENCGQRRQKRSQRAGTEARPPLDVIEPVLQCIKGRFSRVIQKPAHVAPSLLQLAAQEHKIPGYFDPRTGTFSPRLQPAGSPQISTHTGTLVFIFNITIVSDIPKTQAIQCSATASAMDSAAAHFYTGTATVTAKRIGSIATCTVKVPYKWALGSGPTYSPLYSVLAQPIC
jgi:hypothetical protein